VLCDKRHTRADRAKRQSAHSQTSLRRANRFGITQYGRKYVSCRFHRKQNVRSVHFGKPECEQFNALSNNVNDDDVRNNTERADAATILNPEIMKTTGSSDKRYETHVSEKQPFHTMSTESRGGGFDRGKNRTAFGHDGNDQ